MKQALQLKLGQQLTLTPQLQQAIKLLQLSTLDLQQTITETLESNPLLDEEDTLVDRVDNTLKESVGNAKNSPSFTDTDICSRTFDVP